MSQQTIQVVLSSLICLFLWSGCGRDNRPTVTPTATPTISPPTATPSSLQAESARITSPVATATLRPGQQDEAALAQSTDYSIVQGSVRVPVDVLDAFSINGTLILTTNEGSNGDAESELVRIEGAYQATENAHGFNEYYEMVVLRPNQSDPEITQIYRVDEAFVLNVEGEWLVLDREAGGLMPQEADLFNRPLQQLADGMHAASVVGAEDLNGVATIHFRIDDPATFIEITGAQLAEGEELRAAVVDIWVAEQGNYIHGYAMTAEIVNALEFDDEGNEERANQVIDWRFGVTSVGNSSPAVELPVEALYHGEPRLPGFSDDEFPLPEDAELQPNTVRPLAIVTQLGQEEVVDFYQEQLGQLGWRLDGAFGIYEATKGDVSFTLTISTDETGATVVQVAPEG